MDIYLIINLHINNTCDQHTESSSSSVFSNIICLNLIFIVEAYGRNSPDATNASVDSQWFGPNSYQFLLTYLTEHGKQYMVNKKVFDTCPNFLKATVSHIWL